MDAPAAPPTTKSPCVGRCGIVASGVCGGCLRTRDEIRGWKHMTDAQRDAVNRRVAALAASGKDARKLRKLDRKIRKQEAKLADLQTRRDLLAGTPADRPLAPVPEAEPA